MPDWMNIAELVEPKLLVFLVLIGVVLGLSYFGRDDRARLKLRLRRAGLGRHRVRAVSGAAKPAAADPTGIGS